MPIRRLLFVCLLIVCFSKLVAESNSVAQEKVDESFSTTIAAYQDASKRIINSAREGNEGYLKLQELCDDIGARLSGSPELEQAASGLRKV